MLKIGWQKEWTYWSCPCLLTVSQQIIVGWNLWYHPTLLDFIIYLTLSTENLFYVISSWCLAFLLHSNFLILDVWCHRCSKALVLTQGDDMYYSTVQIYQMFHTNNKNVVLGMHFILKMTFSKLQHCTEIYILTKWCLHITSISYQSEKDLLFTNLSPTSTAFKIIHIKIQQDQLCWQQQKRANPINNSCCNN